MQKTETTEMVARLTLKTNPEFEKVLAAYLEAKAALERCLFHEQIGVIAEEKEAASGN